MTVSGFLEHLEHSRYRINLLIALALAASLAWWVAGKSESAIPLFEDIAAAENILSSSSKTLNVELEQLNVWLEVNDPTQIESSAAQLRYLGSTLDSPIASETLSYFSLSNELNAYLGAWRRLRLHSLPQDWKQWTLSQSNDFVTLAISYDQPEHERKSIVDVRAILASPNLHSAQTSNVKLGMDALYALNTGLRLVINKKSVEQTEIIKAFLQLNKSMQDMGLGNISSVLKAKDARATRRALELGSLDAVGFSIPGLAIRLLVPLTALAISIDLLFSLYRTSSLAREFLTQEEVAIGLGGLPWLFSPPDIGIDGRLKRAALARTFVLLTGCTFALAPLVFSGPDGMQKLFGLICLIVTLVTQVFCIRSLSVLHGSASEPYDKTDETILGKLTSQRLKAVSSTFTSVQIACAATLAFFLAFSVIPRYLLEGSTKLHREAKVLEALELSYDQRLREQAQIFTEWCKDGGDFFMYFSFAAEMIANDHPAKPLLESIASDPIVEAQSHAVARLRDVIGESRALIDDLDQEDLELVVEVLYRKDYDTVIKKLTQLQHVLAEHPAPEIMIYLPSSMAEKPSSGISPPFIAPYRVIVERGGFANQLRSLPPLNDVEALLNSIKEIGVNRVGGFKVLEHELAGLDAELGRVNLKLAGVTVPQVVARDVALISLCSLSLAFAIRLRGARLLIAYIQTRPNEPKANIDNLPGVLFMKFASWKRFWRWLSTAHVFLAVLATEMVVIAAPGTSTIHTLFPISCGIFTVSVIIWAAIERRCLLYGGDW